MPADYVVDSTNSQSVFDSGTLKMKQRSHVTKTKLCSYIR